MNILEIKHLRMLKMISRTNNMTKAAEKLYVTQSALSQQLKDLESKLETELFHRTGKKMVLTKVGNLLLKRSELILDKVEEAELDITKMVKGEKGELKIGVRCFFCYSWLPLVIEKFRNIFPNVKIEIGNSFNPFSDIINDKIDIAVSASEEKKSKIDSINLFRDEVLVIMNDNDPLRIKKFMELEDFDSTNVIAMVEKEKHYFYRHFIDNKSVKPKSYMIISHPEAMLDLISAGLGVGILPKWFVKPYLKKKGLKTCSLTKEKSYLEWKASFLNSKKQPHFLSEFIKILSEHAVVN